MKVSVNSEYTSVACNRIPDIADWNSDGIICYGATNAVALYNTQQKGGDPITILSHHHSKVNSVKWLYKPDGTCTEFASCSADKTAAIWTLTDGAYKVTSRLEGHTDGVTSVAGAYLSNRDLIIYTASVDSTVRIWERKDGTTTQRQTITLNSGLCLTLHSHLLPLVSKPILLLALDDHKVHIYAEAPVASGQGDGSSVEYHRLHVLTGHEDWVRGLDVVDVDSETILVASCSQDTYIRLWRIQHHTPSPVEERNGEICVEERLFSAHGLDWSVKLDAVLAGHEGWVYGVQWAPSMVDSATNKTVPCYRLLSSSLDKTLIVWEPAESASREGGVWAEKVRVGEVGGNGLGFYGSRFGPRGTSFMGHGYNGSFHIWTLNQESSQWEPSVVCGGHFGAVEDTRWEPRRGRYLVSVSADQTTRLHAPWRRDAGSKVEWHEIARPQVHGYDMASLALVSSTTLASAAEEKVVRVFRAPHNFVENFRNITGDALCEGMANGGGPEGASVPSLGLSNKAVFSDDDGKADDDNDGYFVPVTLNQPPTEETLMQNTLWPETQKLYGHGYEVFALEASPDGTLLASACKANSVEHAAVLIWETTNWQQIQKLPSHQLTVTQLAFSPDSQGLLSVSRDRRWTLFRRAEGGNSFEQVAVTDKTNGVHARIIWCCAWAHDGLVFGTGSRDGKICVWTKTDTDSRSSLGHYGLFGTPLALAQTSVTALAFAPLVGRQTRVIATGFESGVVRLYSFGRQQDWSLLFELDNSAAHHLTVKRLTFNPNTSEDKGSNREVLLASCGADHIVRVYNVAFDL